MSSKYFSGNKLLFAGCLPMRKILKPITIVHAFKCILNNKAISEHVTFNFQVQ